MAGRRPKLSYGALRRVDAWWRRRSWSVTVMARMLGVSRRTVYDAAYRRNAYRECK